MTKSSKSMWQALPAAALALALVFTSATQAMATDVAPASDAASTDQVNPTPVASESPVAEPTTAPIRSVNAKQVFASRSRDFEAVRALAPFHYKGYFRTAKYAKWYTKNYFQYKYGWGEPQFKCVVTLWQKESSWRPAARMAHNKFLGIPQMSKATVVASGYTVAEFRASTELQIQLGAKYIKYRKGYGTPCKALKHFQRKHWY